MIAKSLEFGSPSQSNPPSKVFEEKEEGTADDLAVTIDTFEYVDAARFHVITSALGKRYRTLVQVVVNPEAARAVAEKLAAKTVAAEAEAAARRERRRAEKAARKEAERRARKEQKHLERRAHLEKLASGCFGPSEARTDALPKAAAARPTSGAGGGPLSSKPPSSKKKKRPHMAGWSYGPPLDEDEDPRYDPYKDPAMHADDDPYARADDDFAPPKKAHCGAKAEKENSTSGRPANVPAAVAGEGVTKKPPRPLQHLPLSDAKRKALKQTTLSFAKKPKSAHAPAAAQPDQEAIVISEEEGIVID
ncbi:hypothetical protein COCOBI_15-1130 [Coccomyxa sp. Obi]|nr:hypothetical protein COCOBI_15-1130 [Coccomyxa sp. Obi]